MKSDSTSSGTTAGGKKADERELSANYSTSAGQRHIILYALKNSKHGLTTFEIRTKFDIPHPGARVMELRNQGHDIYTTWDYDSMPGGDLHRVARYVLMPERQGRLQL
ncbi:MAG: helix-turn-helix domain-containing protein [Candidatus Thiodiazotropha lotti]|nr:helix-turn-helix domain-containing protein [Candidatus Thiodiazotropha lotti]MCW4222481.1 helix-turn-helix domain-containing protein [Candidatus Thiodiazotropha lotti]